MFNLAETLTQTMRSPQNNSNRNLKAQYASQNSTPQTNPFMLTNSRPATILSRREGPIQTKSLPKGIGTLVIPQRTNETGSSKNEILQSKDEIFEEKSQQSNKVDWEELFSQFEEKVTNQLIGSSGRSGYTTSKAGNPFMYSDTRRSSGVLGAEDDLNEPLYLHEAIKISAIQQKERDSSIKKKGRLWVPKELRKGVNSSGEVKDYLREKRLAREEKMLNIDVIDKIHQPVRTRISPKQLLLEQQLQQEDAVNISEEKTVEIEGLLPKLEETYNERRQEKTPNSVAKKRQQPIGGWTSTSFSQTYTEMEADHRGTPINNQKKLSSYSKAVVESKALRSNNKLQRPTVLLEEKSGTVIEGSLGYIKGSSKDLTSLPKVKTETKIKIKAKQQIQLKPLTKKERDVEMAYMKKVNSYKLFMSRINFSYNILIKQEQPVTACYKFYAENGANSQLIQNIMKQRWWWVPVKDKNIAGINFMWTQGVNTKYIGTLQKQRKPGEEAYFETEINGVSCIDWESNLASMNTVVKAAVDSEQNLLLESQATSSRNSPILQTGFDEIKTKQPSLKNLSMGALDEDKKKGSKMKKQKSGTSPMLELEDVELLKNLLTKRELGLMRNYYSTRVKTKKEMNYQDFEEMSKMRSRQTLKYVSDVGRQKICNHMENNGCLSDQADFFEAMRMYYEGKKEDSKNLLRTFYVKGGLEDKEFKAFVECFNQKQKNFGAFVMAKGTRNIAKENTNYWIVKPVGIKLKGNSNPIFNDLTSIIRVIHEGKRLEAELGNNEIVYMIQQYIDRPMLYQKKRMEIKCFIMISTLNNHMKGKGYRGDCE